MKSDEYEVSTAPSFDGPWTPVNHVTVVWVPDLPAPALTPEDEAQFSQAVAAMMHGVGRRVDQAAYRAAGVPSYWPDLQAAILDGEIVPPTPKQLPAGESAP